MRVALLYPPPWKIPDLGDAADFGADGPPADYREGDLDADFHQTPYGLFALGAQAMRAGHSVKVINLSGYPWTRVDEVLRALDADVYGMSCWTANRRGVALVAARLRELRPNVPIVIGGPHATPLAKEMLAHYPQIDLVCQGRVTRRSSTSSPASRPRNRSAGSRGPCTATAIASSPGRSARRSTTSTRWPRLTITSTPTS